MCFYTQCGNQNHNENIISSYKNYYNNLENIVYFCSLECKIRYEMKERCNNCHIWLIPVNKKIYYNFYYCNNKNGYNCYDNFIYNN